MPVFRPWVALSVGFLWACGGEPPAPYPVSAPAAPPKSAPASAPVSLPAPVEEEPAILPSPLGKGWRWSSPALPTTTLLLSWRSPEGELYLAGRRGVLLRSADNGISWQQLPLPAMPNHPCGMGRGEGNELILFTQEGTFRSPDNGDTWTVTQQEAINRCGQIIQDQDGTFFAAVPFGVAISKDKGRTWRERKLSQSHIFKAIALGPSGQLYTTGTIAEIYVSADRGESWRSLGPKFWHDYLALWVSPKNEIYAVGSKGAISYSPDGGASWQDSSRLVGADLYAVNGNEREVFIAGEDGVVLRSEDQLLTVKIQDAALPIARKLGTAPDLRTLLPTGAGGWVTAGGYGAILRSPDGTAWQERFSSLRGVFPAPVSGKEQGPSEVPLLQAVYAKDDATLFAAGPDGVMYRSIDRGIKWSKLSFATGIVPPSFESIWGEGGTVLVVGDGRALLSRDGGLSFGPISLSDEQVAYTAFHDAWGSGDDLYIVGQGQILRSQDGGKSWGYALAPSDEAGPDLRGIWGSGLDDLYAVGGETIFHGSNSGDNWEPLALKPSAPVHDVWGSGADDVYVVGERGLILHSTDGGKSWREERSGTQAHLRAVWGSSNREVFVAGEDGVLLRSTDKGASWQALRPGKTGDILALWGTGPGRLYFADSRGEVIASDDAGRSYRRLYTVAPLWEEDPPVNLRRVFGLTDEILFAAGDEGRLYRSENGGDSWQSLPGDATQIRDVWGSGPDNLYLARESGAIWRSSDAGKTWAALPFSTEDEPCRLFGFGTEIVFVLTRSGLYQSSDQGNTWQKLSLPEGSTKLRDLWASSGNDLYLAGDDGLMLRSADGGANWRKIDTGTRAEIVAIQGVSTKEAYAALTGLGGAAKVLKSTDGGRSWRNLEVPWAGATPGALLVAGPGEVYVSIIETISETDRMGVRERREGRLYHTTDGGKTWREELLRTETPLYGLWRSPGGIVTAVGAGELILQRATQ